MSRQPNCLLIRYEGGHAYVDRSDGHQRVEQYVEMRGFRDREHAIEVARQILANQRDPELIEVNQGPVRGRGQIPAYAYGLGDRMDGSLIVGFVVSHDATGNITVNPELSNPSRIRQQAMERRLQRAAAGVTGEYAAPNVESQRQAESTDSQPPEWSLSDVVVGLAPAWTATRPYWLTWLEVDIEEPGTGTTRVQVMRQLPGDSWRVLGTASVSSGDTRAVLTVNQGFPVGSKMTMLTPSVASAAEGLTVSPRGAMV